MFELWPWITLAVLGAYHGLNPAMGWLFAVALGLQQRDRRAVLRAFTPIALGHALAVAAAILLLVVAQEIFAPRLLGLIGAGVLLIFGLYRLAARSTHPRWVGMRVGFRGLTAWSFLMATAHGAGLMLVPILLPVLAAADAAPTAGHAGHAAHAVTMRAAGIPLPGDALMAVAIHTGAMFAVMAVVALIVYEKVGLKLLRQAWWNLDYLWTGAILLTATIALVLHAL